MLVKSAAYACMIVVLTIPSMVNAADCKSILAKLPKHDPQTNTQVQMVQNFEKQCQERSDASDPQAHKQCIAAGMRGMAVAGNFIAAERMARIECEAGNNTISLNWMAMVINNLNATEADRDAAQEAINAKDQ